MKSKYKRSNYILIFKSYLSALHTSKGLGAREGLVLVNNRGFQNLLLESDSFQFVIALKDFFYENLSVVGHIIEDSKMLIA